MGDLLVSHDGQVAPVEDILDTGTYETVYNFRVADHHTYFVGGEDWGFSVWAHNACLGPVPRADAHWRERTAGANNVKIYGTAQNPTGLANDPHAAHINAVVDRLAANAPAGSYFTLNRSWRTGLGRGSVTTRSGNQDLQPDILYVQNLGNGRYRVRAFEIMSGNQTREQMMQRMNDGWASVIGGNDVRRGRFVPLAIGEFPRGS